MGGLTRTDERPDIATADLGRPTVGLLTFEEIGDLDHRAGVETVSHPRATEAYEGYSGDRDVM